MLNFIFLQTLQIGNWEFFLGITTLIITLGYAIVKITRSINDKADKDKVIDRIEYDKDIKQIGNEIDECNRDVSDVKRKVRAQELKFYAIDKKLDILIYGVNIIKENCPSCKNDIKIDNNS